MLRRKKNNNQHKSTKTVQIMIKTEKEKKKKEKRGLLSGALVWNRRVGLRPWCELPDTGNVTTHTHRAGGVGGWGEVEGFFGEHIALGES